LRREQPVRQASAQPQRWSRLKRRDRIDRKSACGGAVSGAGTVAAGFSGGGASPLSRKFIASRKPLSTIRTTLTPTSSGRVRDGFAASVVAGAWREVRMLRPALVAALRAASVAAASLPGFSVFAAAAACAARRAAAMKFDLPPPSAGAAASDGSAPAARSTADAAALP